MPLSVSFWQAKYILELWSPDKVSTGMKESLQRQFRLHRRARGIVLHDRVLNNEWVRMIEEPIS